MNLDATEKLFRGDCSDWQNNACPHWYASSDNWGLIADGYKNAADKLIELVVVRELISDEMLYPALFLYRHYLELRLKEIIQLNNHLETRSCHATRGHDLVVLWGEVQLILRERVGNMTVEIIESIGNIIKQLQEADTPSAEAFRYPQTTKGKVSLDGIKHINLRHVREVISEVAWVLDGSVYFLSEVSVEQRDTHQ